MTQSSRRRSGSKPFDIGLRKAEADARQRALEAAQAAQEITSEQQAVLDRQMSEGLALLSSGTNRRTLADAKKRWHQEREAIGLDADGRSVRSGEE